MLLVEIHGRLAFTALYYIILMTLWGFWRFARGQAPDDRYWGALAIGEILLLLQAGLGVVVWISGIRQLPGGVHLLYGIVSLLIIPGIYLYTRGDEHRRVMLIYSAGLLFLVGILLRGIATGA